MTASTTQHTTPRPARLAALAVPAGAGAVALALLGYALVSGPRRFTETGDTYPGAATSAAQLIGHFGAMLAGALCLGALVYIVVVARPDDDGRLDPVAYRVHLFVERVAPVWLVLALGMTVVEAAARAGAPATRLLTSSMLSDAVAASESARGWCAAAVFAAVVAVGVRFSVRWVGQLLLVIPAATALIAVPVTGNEGQGPDHDVATSAAIVFTVAVAVLAGTKAAALLSPAAEAQRRRVLLLQVTAGAVALIYGAILLPLAIKGTALWATDYGRLAVVAGVLLAAVWLTDLVMLLRGRQAGPPAAAGACLAMSAVIGALAAMAVQAPPRFLIHPFTSWDVFLGYTLTEPPGPVTLATQWRFDPLLGTAAIALAGVYLFAVFRLRRRGDQWRTGRTVAWVTGCVALLLATSSGVRAYGSAMFSVHMGEHMALNMFIPVLLVLGAPVTLALRALPAATTGQPPGPREWVLWFVHSWFTRFLSHPVTAFAIFVGSLYAVYFTPLFDTLVRYHWGHEFMSVHFLLSGYLFFWGIIGIDPGPKRLPFLGRLGLMFAVMPFHAFFGIATMTMDTNLGDYFYRSLDVPWVTSLTDDQHLGGAIAWGSSELPVIIVVVALVAQWARQDRRAGARHDRHSDRGYEDDLDAYNRMLAELARDRR
ncbi:cytochrome c oxidase assembly protein [Mycolicibacterium palauense]|uniref:cytochrome c oxidase assembly protein n=1 Tax=Mycolicibacterium palauense TaxID=2034511 RepID=UPI000BFEC535|nr:cytochrome c oxidase assembly protein [Mycolicibacterium palauense]